MSATTTAMLYTDLARDLAMHIRHALIDRLVWDVPAIDSRHDTDDLKSRHKTDDIAINVIRNLVADIPCNVYIESWPAHHHPDAKFSLFIDPIDGSINWDRGIGDPCVALAIAEKVEDVCLGDLTYAYVLGLRSGDAYETRDGYAYYRSGLTCLERPIKTSAVQDLDRAMGYIKIGYGGATQQIEICQPLLAQCQDLRSIDNSAIELCELARGATDLIVDGRSLSDSFNLISYPILKQAGGILCDLAGNSLDSVAIAEGETVDYVACANVALRDRVLLNVRDRDDGSC
jgi:fructose-1,6-bisphosphatase/inositol monophosphatase family enzyme